MILVERRKVELFHVLSTCWSLCHPERGRGQKPNLRKFLLTASPTLMPSLLFVLLPSFSLLY